MCVISESNIDKLEDVLVVLNELPCDEIILQEMIGLNATEISQYKCICYGLNWRNSETGDKIIAAVTMLIVSGAALLLLLAWKKKKQKQ